MINVIENSNAPVCDYRLVTSDGDLLGKAKLTQYEARIKNYAFRINRADKLYELISCEGSDKDEKVKLILPHKD